MNATLTSFGLLLILFVVGLLVFLALRAATSKPRLTHADHYHWIVRSLAALLAVSAVVATAVGTWRGTVMMEDLRPVSVTIPTRAPQPLKPGESINPGAAKLIGTVIVARWVDGRFLPLSGQSRVCDPQSQQPWRMEFSGRWQDSNYELGMDLDRFVATGEGELYPQGPFTYREQGSTWSRSGGGSAHPIGMLNLYELGNGRGALQNAPLSLVPYGEQEDVYLLFQLERADAGDPLTQIEAAQWLEGKSTSHLDFSSGRRNRNLPYPKEAAPGVRMLAYLGPSALLLLLAAGAGSLCFRYGLRAPAFAGLTAAMVLYAGSLDAMVLDRRAKVMKDASLPESTRLNAMAAVSGTFFHAKRAGLLRDEATREGKLPPSMGGNGR